MPNRNDIVVPTGNTADETKERIDFLTMFKHVCGTFHICREKVGIGALTGGILAIAAYGVQPKAVVTGLALSGPVLIFVFALLGLAVGWLVERLLVFVARSGSQIALAMAKANRAGVDCPIPTRPSRGNHPSPRGPVRKPRTQHERGRSRTDRRKTNRLHGNRRAA
jgi:hypothetical protein